MSILSYKAISERNDLATNQRLLDIAFNNCKHNLKMMSKNRIVIMKLKNETKMPKM